VSRFNGPLWSKQSWMSRYGYAFLLLVATLLVSRWLSPYIGFPGTLFLCAVVLSAWFGGVGPGLLATIISVLAFHYYFRHSPGPKPKEMPRLLLYIVLNLLIGMLSAAQRSAKESLRCARDDLKRTVQDLQKSNEALRRSDAYLAEAQRLSHAGSFGWNVSSGEIYWCTMVDVTERKRAEETLRESEAYLAEAQRLSQTGSWAWVPATGEIRYCSEECYRVLGIDPQGGQPRFETLFERIHPEDQPRIAKALERATRERVEFEVNDRVVYPGGEIRDVHVVGHPILSPSGDLVEFVGTLMDVTERKRAEEERERLRQVQDDLAHLSRVATMGELTASLAHEIRQPIAAATTDARTCLRWLGREQPEVAEAREAAARTVKDVTRAAEIIGRISALFKKGAPQRELVDVDELIREMFVLLRSEANRCSISIRTQLAPDLPKVMADPVQLQQVFMNLMLNGIDAMKGTTDGGELTIKSEAGDGQLLISVSDTGMGFPPEQADQLFRAFVTTKDKGTGMGLPISRSIIESHGGRLWAASASGRGATFHFTLPVTQAAHA
jgi:PAS domain S-box-containing protein